MSQLVEQHQVEPSIAGHDPAQDPFVGGLGQLVDQPGGGHVAHAPPLFTGGQAQADQEVALAGATVAEQHHRLAGVDPGARLQRGQRGGLDGRCRGQVELTEALESWKARLGDAPLTASRLAILELGREHLGQVGAVAEPLAQRGLGQCCGLLAHGRQAQGAAGAGRGRRPRSTAPRPARSAARS